MSACGLCGHTPACGQAEIDGTRYCHGDCPHETGDRVSCYIRANLAAAIQAASDLIAMIDDPEETQ